MRNPDRQGPVLDKLQELWGLVPDWRLGQLMWNLTQARYHDRDAINDLWNTEESVWLERIEALIEQIEENKKRNDC